jgi:Rod binding domain-containing protein
MVNAIGSYSTYAAPTYEDKVRVSCAEFERTLLRQMLREIRSGSLVESSSESRSYMEIADDRMADSLVRSGGVGLGAAMAEQFLRQIDSARSIGLGR